MKYAIETLEIEIARLRLSLRKAHETNISYQDLNDGYPPDISGMEAHLSELQDAIKVLKEHMKEESPISVFRAEQ
jgi:hypothetical protein